MSKYLKKTEIQRLKLGGTEASFSFIEGDTAVLLEMKSGKGAESLSISIEADELLSLTVWLDDMRTKILDTIKKQGIDEETQ